jgi:hypothetical protein
MATGSGRVQFVISGPFLLLVVLALGFFAGGFWLYTHQPPPVLPPAPPYYVNRTSTALRPCFQCIGTDGRLKAQPEWKLGKALDIPADERWWFAPVEEQPTPVKIDGIPLLAVHPAANKDKPWYGFDQRRVFLAVMQDLEPRFAIEHPAPPPISAPIPAPQPTTDAPPPIPQP